ncbi:MAG TPA: hypothetical protein VFM87_02045, partial [Agrococcus sp.]|nr:hypothetical protein [Agrococcus sp.]
MQRNQWILVGTAGVLSVSVLSLGAVSIASAMDVRDASGAPVSGGEIRGVALGSADLAELEKPGAAGDVVAPMPTSTPEPSPTSAAAAASAPAPSPAPAPAP